MGVRRLSMALCLGNEQLFVRRQKDNGQWEWEKAPAVSPVPSPSNGTPMLGNFPSLPQVVYANAALSTSIGYHHFPASALSPPTGQAHGQSLLQKVPGLSDTASNYLEVMRGITQDFRRPNIRKNLLASLRVVHPAISSIELDSLVNPQRAIIAHKEMERVFELGMEQESDGLPRFYAHLLALYQTPPKLVLIFEQPENAIFPGALALLADEFKAAPREQRGQVIITTHNPTFLDSFDVDDVRAVEMRDGATVVGGVSKEQRQSVKDHLLTVDRARLDDKLSAQQTA